MDEIFLLNKCNSNDSPSFHYHRFPPVSQKTQRELAAQTERFMKEQQLKDEARTQRSSKSASPAPASAATSASTPVTNGHTNSSKHSEQNGGDVEMKSPEADSEPHDKKDGDTNT